MEFEYLKTNKILTKRYRATPKLTSHYGEKYFRTLGETVNYLNKYTGYNFKLDDWKMVGKILYRGNRRHGYKYKKYSAECPRWGYKEL